MSNKNNTKQMLTTAFLKQGQSVLADVWGCDASEAGRRLNGQRNISLDDFCAALDVMGVTVVTDHEAVVITKEKYVALETLAREALDNDLTD